MVSKGGQARYSGFRERDISRAWAKYQAARRASGF
jgi:hypothetical protein